MGSILVWIFIEDYEFYFFSLTDPDSNTSCSSWLYRQNDVNSSTKHVTSLGKLRACVSVRRGMRVDIFFGMRFLEQFACF